MIRKTDQNDNNHITQRNTETDFSGFGNTMTLHMSLIGVWHLEKAAQDANVPTNLKSMQRFWQASSKRKKQRKVQSSL